MKSNPQTLKGQIVARYPIMNLIGCELMFKKKANHTINFYSMEYQFGDEDSKFL
jgi:hypothetical protein